MSTVVVVKVGTSSITSAPGEIDDASLLKLCREIAAARADGHEVVLVSSGAIAAGLPALGMTTRPTDIGTLQAVAAVGQPRLMERLGAILGTHGLLAGRCCSPPTTSACASQYLHAREAMRRLLDLGVVPVVNENDTVADDEIRYGDNDRLAALVSHLVAADLLVLLTDTAGLFTADPRVDAEASLIEEIVEVDAALEALAGGRGTERGSGGMATKLAAAKIAAWSGVRAVIAAADAPDVVTDAIAGRPVGTAFPARGERLSSRKVWIAFARDAGRPGGRRRRRPPGAVRAPPLSAARRGPGRGGRLRRRRRGRDRRRRRPAVRERAGQVPRGGAPPGRGPADVGARGRRCPTRSSTGTTSSCLP